MIRFFFGTLFIIFLVYFGWSYLPESAQNGFAGLFAALSPARSSIREFLEEKIIPKTPEEQREILLKDLREKIAQIKERISESAEKNSALEAEIDDSFSPNGKTAQESSLFPVQGLIKEAEKLVEQLESVNQETSLGRRTSDKVLDAAFPEKEKDGCACGVE